MRHPTIARPVEVGQSVVKQATDFAHHIQVFCDAKEVSLKPKSVKNYERLLTQFGRETAWTWPPTVDGINGFMASARRRGLSDASLDNYFRHLRAWLNWLEKRGHLEHNPIKLAERPKLPKLLPRAPKADAIQRLFTLLERYAKRGAWLDFRDWTLFSLLLDCGLRCAEAQALNIEHLDLDRLTIEVRQSKGYTEGTVCLSPELGARLSAWLVIRSGLGLPNDLDAVFVARYRGRWQRLQHFGIRRALRKHCTEAGIKRVTPHQLRHACAILALRNGSDLVDVQHQLRHKDLASTARYLVVADAGRTQRHAVSSPLSGLSNGK